MSTEKQGWLGKPSTREEREAHEALGDKEVQHRSDLDWASMSGGSPASRKAAKEELDRLEASTGWRLTRWEKK